MYRQLKNERLTVTVTEPGHDYCEQRFDWTGFVTQVTLDGNHTFCAYESNNPMQGSGGIGLCSAFMGIKQNNYDATPVGCEYLSIGVGRVTRTSEAPYNFMARLPVRPFKTDVTADAHKLSFCQTGESCNGFMYELEKDVSICENKLKITTRLLNTGEQTIDTTEFNHNFLCIDEAPLGPDYKMTLPYTPEITIDKGNYVIETKSLSLRHMHEKDYFYCNVNNFDSVADHFWELIHLPSGVSVRETGDFTVCAFNIWGRSHVVSPEVFVKINIAPGKKFEWTRFYSFDKK
ncbi:MAG: hypothetical protein FWE82_05885 [Defluviitaleaceae bacterium]|nr:hypothetical protein [Defluviitaleaceae bacterium]